MPIKTCITKDRNKVALYVVVFLLLFSTACTGRQMGDVYILITDRETPGNTHQLLRIPSDCFIHEVECPNPEKVVAFPNIFTTANWINLSWSPDGKYAMVVNDVFDKDGEVKEELLLLDAVNLTIETIASGYKYITAPIWNPDNKWAAVGFMMYDEQDMRISLVTTDGRINDLPVKSASDAGYTPHIFNGQIFDCNQYPVLWINEKELLFVRSRGEKSDNPDDWPVIPVDHLFKYNIETSTEVELKVPRREGISLSPDGGKVSFFTRNIMDNGGSVIDDIRISDHIYDLKTQRVIDIGNDARRGAWSPDGRWMSLWDFQRGILSVISSDGRKKQKIVDGCTNCVELLWMPDSDHLIVMQLDPTSTKPMKLFAASIKAGKIRNVNIPGLDFDTYNINSISVQPQKP